MNKRSVSWAIAILALALVPASPLQADQKIDSKAKELLQKARAVANGTAVPAAAVAVNVTPLGTSNTVP